MAIEKTLLLKGLAGVAALGGVGGVGGVVIKNKLDERAAEEKKKEEAEKLEDKKNAKKEEVNEKLKTLGIEGCELDNNNISDTTTFSKDCELDQTKFKKIKFSNKDGDNDVNVEGWTNGNTVKLTISNKDDGGIKFLFKEVKDDLTISKSSADQTDKFSIRKGKETEFEEIDSKLSKIISDQTTSTKLKTYNTKFQTLSLPETCRFDDTEDEKKLECDVKESELKTINFSNKGDGQLTLNGLTDSDKIKLIIERAGTGEAESLKYKFKNDKKDNITIIGTSGEQKKMVLKASSETEFEEKENKLSKIISDTATSTKLKEHNKKLEKLSLPDDCIFDVADTDTSLECDVTTENITKIKFSNKENDNLTISEGNGFSGLKLNISGSGNDLKFNFKGVNKKIKLSSGEKHVFIKKDEESEFEFKGEALHKVPKKVNELTSKVKLICEYGNSGDGGTCKLDDGRSYLNVSKKTNPSDHGAIPIGSGGYEKDKVKFNFQEDQDDYEGKVKFTFTGEIMEGDGAKLENNASYEIKTIGDFDCLSKKDPQ